MDLAADLAAWVGAAVDLRVGVARLHRVDQPCQVSLGDGDGSAGCRADLRRGERAAEGVGGLAGDQLREGNRYLTGDVGGARMDVRERGAGGKARIRDDEVDGRLGAVHG